jgi:hypothetical protein
MLAIYLKVLFGMWELAARGKHTQTLQVDLASWIIIKALFFAQTTLPTRFKSTTCRPDRGRCPPHSLREGRSWKEVAYLSVCPVSAYGTDLVLV